MNIIILILTFILTANLYSQEYESDSISILRERWMVGHRMFPANEIPSHALPDAIRYRDSLRVHQGFFVNHRFHNNPYEYSPLGWSSLGPTPGHFDSYGAISGRCSFVKYDPSNPNIIYVGGAGGGLWKSIDNGTTFMPLTDNLPSLSSGAIAIDEANNIIYYGTGESTYFTYVYYGYGMYKSTDGGNSFSQIGGGLPFPCYISAIAIKPNQRNVILAAVGCNYTNWNYQAGIYKSTDYGATFQRIVPDPGLQGLVCTDIAFSPDGSTAYAVGPQNNSPNVWEDGVGYRLSTDGGTTFPLRNDIVYVQNRTKLSICTSSPNRMYIITNWYDANNNNLNYIDIYKSLNAGLSYSLVWHHYVTESGWDYIQPYYNLCIKVHPNYPDLVYFGITALYISNDGCSTFNKIGGYGMSVHPDMHCIDLIPGEGNQNKVIVSCDGGIYSSLNYGNSWSNLNSTLTLTQFYRMSANKDNLDNVLACSQDNGMQQKAPNYSHVWTDIEGGDMGNVKFNPINSNYCFAKNCWSGYSYFSNNSGSSFSSAANIFHSAWIMPIINHPSIENILYTSGSLISDQDPPVILISNNYGQTWTPISSDFPQSPAEQMAISNSNPNVIYASIGSISFWPYSYSEQKLYKTVNSGTNWTDLGIMEGSNPPIPKRYISAIAINPINENEVYLGLSGFGCGHIWKTTDGGNSWSDISKNLPKVPVNSIVIENLSMMIGSNVIAGTDCGVFILPYGSNNWLEVGSGLPNSIVMDLDIKPYSSILRAATHGRGVWEIDLRGEGGSNKLYVTGLKRYNLNQNYPNPFNPSTIISYEVPIEVNVTIKIFDVIGREVTTLVNNEFKKSGVYTFEWNASKYASGIYFYRLEAGEYKNVRKMMLVK